VAHNNREIIIFGGTFDPPHIGHLLIAEQARERFASEYLMMMPAKIPPHKNTTKVTPIKARLEMLRRAIANNPNLILSQFEIKSQGISYTAKTLQHFLQLFTEVGLVIGADSLAEIFTWKDPEYILANSKLLVAPRPGYDIEELLQESRFKDYRQQIITLDSVLVNISSSDVRIRAAKGQSIRYFVPPAVREYIIDNNLYGKEEKK